MQDFYKIGFLCFFLMLFAQAEAAQPNEMSQRSIQSAEMASPNAKRKALRAHKKQIRKQQKIERLVAKIKRKLDFVDVLSTIAGILVFLAITIGGGLLGMYWLFPAMASGLAFFLGALLLWLAIFAFIMTIVGAVVLFSLMAW
ncbi:MAG: hypothetical protein JJT94_03050 [Bernardetiaceae bacterium]|nr:hypothetical protein [Bernardetiaceae bacterium]